MAVLNTMACMLITRLALTMSGDPKWMNVVLSGIEASKPDKTLAKSANDFNQKLTLNNKLCSAFCTRSGLSEEAVDRIWEDTRGNV